MPPQFLIDISEIDLSGVAFDQEAIRRQNPQRGDMEHLNAIVWADKSKNSIIGRKDVGMNEFWIPGHIPGRPLLPGVIMLEAAAQLASFYTKQLLEYPGFIGFGGIGETKFRSEVHPGATLYMLCMHTWSRHRRIGCNVQGLVNGGIVFETSIIGAVM